MQTKGVLPAPHCLGEFWKPGRQEIQNVGIWFLGHPAAGTWPLGMTPDLPFLEMHGPVSRKAQVSRHSRNDPRELERWFGGKHDVTVRPKDWGLLKITFRGFFLL